MFQVGIPNRVVSTYFAPSVQISTLGALSSQKSNGSLLPDDVLGDIVHAEVTRVCSGASQYSITLNNWYTSTAVDRASQSTGGSNQPTSTELSSGSQPRWPRFKYNDFGIIAFGQRLRVDMRYWPDITAGTQLSKPASQALSWVPMVCGPVTDMRFTFSSGGGAQLTISGEDDLSTLKDRSSTRTEFPSMPERQIVREVLRLAKYPLSDVAPPQVAWPPFADDGGDGIVESILDGQSYLEFLQKLADRLDLEVFLEFTDLTDPNSALQLHVEPCRARVAPDRSAGDVFVLDREHNLTEFNPTIRVVDQPSSVYVKGRDRDRNNPRKVTGIADPSDQSKNILIDEMYPDDSDGPPQPLVSGPLVRARYFPNRSDNPLSQPNATNLDPQRAQVLAETLLRYKAREFFTIEGTTLGLPRLRPGNYVQITGMRPPFDGFFYVTKTVHSFGGDGLRTKFSARRPGMPLPPYGET
jgi:hypothetical protein